MKTLAFRFGVDGNHFENSSGIVLDVVGWGLNCNLNGAEEHRLLYIPAYYLLDVVKFMVYRASTRKKRQADSFLCLSVV